MSMSLTDLPIAKKLALGFAAVLAIVLFSGLLGVYTVREIGTEVDELLSVNVVRERVVNSSRTTAMAIRGDVAEILASHRTNQAVEQAVEAQLGKLRLQVANLRFGSNSAKFDEVAKGMGEIERSWPEVTLPINEEGDAQLVEIEDQISDLEQSSLAAFDAHRRLNAYYFEIDGQARNLVSLLEAVTVELANWQAGIAESIKFASEPQVPLTVEKTLVGKWRAQYASLPDEDLEKLAAKLEKRWTDTIEYARDNIFGVPEDQRESQLVRLQTRRVPKLQKALDKLVEAARPVIDDRMAARNLAVSSVDEAAGLLTKALHELGKQAIENATQRANEVGLALTSAILWIVAGMAAALVAAAVIGYLLSLAVAAPLRKLIGLTVRLADGDLAFEVPNAERRDEIGKLARALAVFRSNAEEKLLLEKRQAEDKEQAEKARKAELDGLAQSLQISVGEVAGAMSSTVDELERCATSQAEMASETSAKGASVASSIGVMSDNIQALAASNDQLSSAVGEISEQLARSTGKANDAVARTEKANETVSELVVGAEKIDTVVSLISDIAEQTNLLALNATIEAARAGSAGRGFAVVAQEVKALAAQTTSATEQIGKQIKSMQASCESVAKVVRDIGGAVSDIEMASTTISGAVEEQSAVTRELAASAQQSAASVTDISENIEDVRSRASDAESGSQVLRQVTEELAGHSSKLRAEVARFIEQMKAA